MTWSLGITELLILTSSLHEPHITVHGVVITWFKAVLGTCNCTRTSEGIQRWECEFFEPYIPVDVDVEFLNSMYIYWEVN